MCVIAKKGGKFYLDSQHENILILFFLGSNSPKINKHSFFDWLRCFFNLILKPFNKFK